MKTIVAPTDFSDISINAAYYAASMACVIGTNLSLIHVCSIPLSFSEVPSPIYTVEELIADAEQQMIELKEKIINKTLDRIEINTEVKAGKVVSEIENYCAAVNTYAVVMGTESASAFERFLFGGKTIAAIQHVLCPLIVVPPDAKFTSIHKIGLACDFKKVEKTIPAKEIKNLIEEFGAELHVLHVSSKKEHSFSLETVEECQWLKSILKQFNPTYHFISDSNIEKSIHEFAEKNNLDLLIIIPKEHTFINKIFSRSHSKNLVLQAHVPVMAIHE